MPLPPLRSLPPQPSLRPAWSAAAAVRGRQLPRCRGRPAIAATAAAAAARQLPQHAYSPHSHRIAAAAAAAAGARSFATSSNGAGDNADDAVPAAAHNGPSEGTTKEQRSLPSTGSAAEEEQLSIKITRCDLSRPRLKSRSEGFRGPRISKFKTSRGSAPPAEYRSIFPQSVQNVAGAPRGEPSRYRQNDSSSSLAGGAYAPKAVGDGDVVFRSLFHGTDIAREKERYVRRGDAGGRGGVPSRGKPTKSLENVRRTGSGSSRSLGRRMEGQQSREGGGALDRLHRLALMGSSVRSDAEKTTGGPRIGAITRDVIMEDATWQRLKQGLVDIAEKEADSAAAAAAAAATAAAAPEETKKSETHEHPTEQWTAEERELAERKDTAVLNKKEKQQRKTLNKEKDEPTTITGRLRAAMGDIKTSLSAQLEDKPRPSRYRQVIQPASESDEDQPAPDSVQDQSVSQSVQDRRLDELESLLIQAAQRLRELRGYKPAQDGKAALLDLSTGASLDQGKAAGDEGNSQSNLAQEGELDAFTKAGLDEEGSQSNRARKGEPDAFTMAGLDKAARPRPTRFLSKDPSRPLPHETEQAIPAELLGPRKPLTSTLGQQEEPVQKTPKKSLLEEVLLDVPDEHRPKATDSHPEATKPNLEAPGPDLEATGPSPEASVESSETQTKSSADELLPILQQSPRRKSSSLYQELFPELDFGVKRAQRPPSEEREVPKLSLDLQAQSFERRSGLIERKDWINRQMQAKYLHEIVVVKLSGVSRNLSEEDIRRLVPQSSKYIEGWADPDYIKVIPVRDEQSLERQDSYYILFRNVRAARDFQERASALHRMTKLHVASSLLSAMAPPPGFLDDKGIDVHTALQAYTLGPPVSDKINCSIVPVPYQRHVRQLLERGGYEPIVAAVRRDESDRLVSDNNNNNNNNTADNDGITKVLFWFEGPQPSLNEVRRNIARDARDRGLPWQVVGGANNPDGVVKLDTMYSQDEAVGDDLDARMVRKVSPRYVVSFESKGEAQRFARRWHRELFAFRWGAGPNLYENGEGPPEARAEVLW